MKRIILIALAIFGITTGDLLAGAVYNLHLATDAVPDYTDIDSFVHSATDAWQTPQEKAIAIWRWGRRSRRQTSCAAEEGRGIWDPILHYNSYGALNCGIISSLNIACWRQLGFRGRYIQLGDHTVSEVSWDEGKSWHLFDSSMSVFCFNHDGVVASVEEIRSEQACELSGGKREKGHYYLYHVAPQCGSHLGPTGWRCASDQPVLYKRTLFEGLDSYLKGPSYDKYCQVARTGHRYTLNLRPFESYTRYWSGLDKEENANKELAYFRPMPKGTDPDLEHGLKNFRGNGRWILKPDLGSKECRKSFHEESGVALKCEDGAGANLHPGKAGEGAYAVFKIYGANVITSMHIEAAGIRGEGDVLRLLVSRDCGLHWEVVWEAKDSGKQAIALNLRDPVAGVTQSLVKVEMKAGRDVASVGLDSLAITTITQVNRLNLPKLVLGANQVLLKADEQAESAELWPVLHNGGYKRTACGEDGVFSDTKADGMYKATLGAGENNRECSVTWKLAVPSDITGVNYTVISTNRSTNSWVGLKHSWDGKQFEQFHLKKSGEFPFDEQVNFAVAGDKVPAGAREASFRGVFFCKNGAATYGMPGIQDLLMRVSYKPRDPGVAPLEVTYCWIEHRESGDVTRRHTEIVPSLPHKYSINVAGRRDPTMLWVRMNLVGHSPEGRAVQAGYSDGVDVGPGALPKKVVYRWGQSIAMGKSYTVSRPSSKESGNPDTDGRELTNGIIIAPTDYATAKMVQEATAFWDSGEPVTITVDLEKAAKIAGVRISTHQPNAKYCHPAKIEVSVSEDGSVWRAAGTINHDDLWRPPGDFEPWEHETSPDYAKLPAGGRLAYSFPLVLSAPQSGRYVKFVFTPLEGRGMGLSELGVFERVEVRDWPKEIVLREK